MLSRPCAPPLLLASWLLLLLLLCSCSPPVRALAGEYCHGGADPVRARYRGFHCPERYDGAAARYCCGTCALRYCCSDPAARLDQSTCTDPDPDPTEGVRHLEPSLPTYLPFVIVVSVFLSFVLLATVVSVCCCHCLKPKPGERLGGSAPTQAQTGLLESGGPSPKSSTPSRSSTAGSAGPLHPPAPAPTPSELSLYGPAVSAVVGTGGGASPAFPGAAAAFAAPMPQGAPQFYPPYLGYTLPPEHTLMMAPAFLDSRSVFGQPHGQHFPQAPMHTEPIYPASVTV